MLFTPPAFDIPFKKVDTNVKIKVDHFAALRAWPSTDGVAFQTSGGASKDHSKVVTI